MSSMHSMRNVYARMLGCWRLTTLNNTPVLQWCLFVLQVRVARTLGVRIRRSLRPRQPPPPPPSTGTMRSHGRPSRRTTLRHVTVSKVRTDIAMSVSVYVKGQCQRNLLVLVLLCVRLGGGQFQKAAGCLTRLVQ